MHTSGRKTSPRSQAVLCCRAAARATTVSLHVMPSRWQQVARRRRCALMSGCAFAWPGRASSGCGRQRVGTVLLAQPLGRHRPPLAAVPGPKMASARFPQEVAHTIGFLGGRGERLDFSGDPLSHFRSMAYSFCCASFVANIGALLVAAMHRCLGKSKLRTSKRRDGQRQV